MIHLIAWRNISSIIVRNDSVVEVSIGRKTFVGNFICRSLHGAQTVVVWLELVSEVSDLVAAFRWHVRSFHVPFGVSILSLHPIVNSGDADCGGGSLPVPTVKAALAPVGCARRLD
jgi:hypothetical protein